MIPAVANSIISRAYSTPVGTIISLYGKTAPAGYLACDGATYNRDDYPDLAEYLVGQFEDLVGDGETTFKVPDLQGEFLRGTGTNTHTNQGSGDTVGVHQDGTEHLNLGLYTGRTGVYVASFDSPSTRTMAEKRDFTPSAGPYRAHVAGQAQTVASQSPYYTSRPTNTSVLYCIKY